MITPYNPVYYFVNTELASINQRDMFSFLTTIFSKIFRRRVVPGILLVIAGIIIQACNNDEFIERLDLPDDITCTHLPTDLSQMQKFAPIGQMRVIPKVHGGYLIGNPFQPNAVIPVYVMADGIILNIQNTRLKYQFFEGMSTEMVSDFTGEARICER
jgi:hypothetical protein